MDSFSAASEALKSIGPQIIAAAKSADDQDLFYGAALTEFITILMNEMGVIKSMRTVGIVYESLVKAERVQSDDTAARLTEIVELTRQLVAATLHKIDN